MSSASERPPMFPTPKEEEPEHGRAVFSSSIHNVGSHHVTDDTEDEILQHRHRRRNQDQSLHLIDDLTNRPLDPLFFDSQLVARPRSNVVVWATRIIVFVICVAVGFVGTLMVKQLNTDPRKAVRSSLINELQQQNSTLKKTSDEVDALRAKVSKQYGIVSQSTQSSQQTKDEMIEGTVGVTGPGIVLTVPNPISLGANNADQSRSGAEARAVTDADLQTFVSLLWKSGAEAISINGHRIGVNTSVRTAGSVILIGVDQVSSPYTIQAIGDRKQLAHDISSKAEPDLYATLQSAGIFPHVKQERSLNLNAIPSTELTYARRRK